MRAGRPIGSSFVVLSLLLSGARPAGAIRAQEGWVPLRADGNGVAALRTPVVVQAHGEPLSEVLRSIRRQAGLGLVFGADLPGLDRPITLTDSAATAARALLRVLDGTGLRVLISTSGQVVVVQGEAAVPMGGTVRGFVFEAGTTQPIPDVEVAIEGARLQTFTDRTGWFRFDSAQEGELVLVLRRMGYAPQRTSVRDPSEELVIELVPAPTPLSAVIVSPGTFGVLEETTAKRTLTRQEIEAAPQLGEDPLRSISRLPGVVGHDLSSNFGIRGSDGREVLLRLDGVDLIEPFHLKDVDAALSIIDIDAIGGVELMTGGFGAQYGDRTAGVFDMRTATVRPGRARTTLGLSLTNLRGASAGTFADDRGDWLVSARRGYIDLALKLGGSDDDLSPRYWDVLGKVEYRFSPGTKLSAHVLGAGDRLHWRQSSSDPDLDSRYGSAYGWLRLDAALGQRWSSTTVASTGQVTWNRLGSRSTEDDEPALNVLEDRAYRYGGVRQELQFDALPSLLLRAGLDAQTRTAEYVYRADVERWIPAGSIFLTEVDRIAVDTRPGETYTGVWLTTRFRPVTPLTLEVGGRWDRHSHTGDSDFGPRLNVAWVPGGGTSLRAAWGRYFQAQGLHELQVQNGVSEFQPSERASHEVIGVEHEFGGGLDLRLDVWSRSTSRVQSRYVNLIDTGDVFPELSPTRIRIEPEAGRARGIELWARHRALRGFDWSASFALSSAEQRIDGRWVPRPRDQRAAFGFDVSYTADGRWRFSTAWQVHSGWPWTPTTLNVDTVGTSLWVTRQYGAYNSDRLPAYHRLDVRVSREVRTSRSRLLFFIDVYNLYGRMNARTLVPYLYAIRNGVPITRLEEDTLLPRLPSFGIQWEF